MKKRAVSLLLVVSIVLSLLAGLGGSALALENSSEVTVTRTSVQYTHSILSGPFGSHRSEKLDLSDGRLQSNRASGSFYGNGQNNDVDVITVQWRYTVSVSTAGTYSFGGAWYKDPVVDEGISGSLRVEAYMATGTETVDEFSSTSSDYFAPTSNVLHLDADVDYSLIITVTSPYLSNNSVLYYCLDFAFLAVTLDPDTNEYAPSAGGTMEDAYAAPSGWYPYRVDTDGYYWYCPTNHDVFNSPASGRDTSTASCVAGHMVNDMRGSEIGITYSLGLVPAPVSGIGYGVVEIISVGCYLTEDFTSRDDASLWASGVYYNMAPGGRYSTSPMQTITAGSGVGISYVFRCPPLSTLTYNARFYLVVLPSEPEVVISDTYNYYNYSYNTPTQGSYTNGATTEQFIDVENQAVVVIKDDGSTETHSYTSGYFDVRTNTFIWENELAGESGSVTYTDNGTIISVAGNGLTINYNYYYEGVDPSTGVSGDGVGGQGGGTGGDEGGGSIWDWIKDRLGKAYEWVEDRILNVLGTLIDTLFGWLIDILRDILDALWSLVKSVIGFFGDVIGGIGSSITQFFGHLTEFYDDSRVSWDYDGLPTPTPGPGFGDGSGEGGGGQGSETGGGIQ